MLDNGLKGMPRTALACFFSFASRDLSRWFPRAMVTGYNAMKLELLRGLTTMQKVGLNWVAAMRKDDNEELRL